MSLVRELKLFELFLADFVINVNVLGGRVVVVVSILKRL